MIQGRSGDVFKPINKYRKIPKMDKLTGERPSIYPFSEKVAIMG
jgi:hypothetical protein